MRMAISEAEAVRRKTRKIRKSSNYMAKAGDKDDRIGQSVFVVGVLIGIVCFGADFVAHMLILVNHREK